MPTSLIVAEPRMTEENVMDVDTTLAELRARTARCLRPGARDERPEGWTEDATEALELITALDEFLSRGGFLPAGWAR